MSTLFHEHLCDIRRESLLKAKLEFEKDISYRLVTDVIDKVEDAKNSLREQARALQLSVLYTFVVDISDINQKHALYLEIAKAAGVTAEFYKPISMIQNLLTRRLPEEFSGMHVEFYSNNTCSELYFSVSANL
jgi:hypothetical protein